MRAQAQKPDWQPAVLNYLDAAVKRFGTIDAERREALNALAERLAEVHRSHGFVRLVYICTHNSRRSHLSQVWSQVAAAYYGVPRVECYSGGTEATALNPRAAAALARAGLEVQVSGSGSNPVYTLRYARNLPPLTGFSKKYDDPANPSAQFVAVMTCSQADQACPAVPGAEVRFALPYDDPKTADNTPQETARYDERCLQIATEQLYLMQQLARSVSASAVAPRP